MRHSKVHLDLFPSLSTLARVAGAVGLASLTSVGVARAAGAPTITEFSAGSASSVPGGITSGPDGNLWFTEIEGDVIGSISPGKRADLLITRCDSTRLTPAGDPVAALVLYANASDIDTVFIDGEVVKHEGKLAGVDWPKIRDELRQSAKDIFARSKKAPFEQIKEEVHKVMASFAGQKL